MIPGWCRVRPPPPQTSLLCVGRAAEELPDRLGDGVAVDAEDSKQLVGFGAAGNLRDGQAVDGEARLVHQSRTHGLTETTCGLGSKQTSELGDQSASILCSYEPSCHISGDTERHHHPTRFKLYSPDCSNQLCSRQSFVLLTEVVMNAPLQLRFNEPEMKQKETARWILMKLVRYHNL